MPTYTYRCRKCGHEFERFQSMSDDPVKRCERCKSKVQRVFHPVGIVLKGPGFHKTDSRSSGKKASSEKSTSQSTSDKKSSSDGKSSEKKSASSGKDSSSSGGGSSSDAST